MTQRKRIDYSLYARTETIIAVTAAAAVLAITFWLDHIPELFRGGAALGALVNNLAQGYLVSWIFWLLVVYRPEKRRERDAFEFAGLMTDRVVANSRQVIYPLLGLAGTEPDAIDVRRVTHEQIAAALAVMDPRGEAPMIVGFGPGGPVRDKTTWRNG